MLRRWSLVTGDISETLLPPSQATWEQVHTTSFTSLSSPHSLAFTQPLCLPLPSFSTPIPLLHTLLPPSYHLTFPSSHLFFFFFHLSRAGAPPLHGPPESSSTPPVHGALGQTHVQCLRRLLCHSSTCSKGIFQIFSVVSKCLWVIEVCV